VHRPLFRVGALLGSMSNGHMTWRQGEGNKFQQIGMHMLDEIKVLQITRIEPSISALHTRNNS